MHPADLYVGLRSERLFVEREQPLEVDVIVTDLDGKPVAGREIKCAAVRLDWSYKDGSWQEVEGRAPAVHRAVRRQSRSAARFETPEGGTYRITRHA